MLSIVPYHPEVASFTNAPRALLACETKPKSRIRAYPEIGPSILGLLYD